MSTPPESADRRSRWDEAKSRVEQTARSAAGRSRASSVEGDDEVGQEPARPDAEVDSREALDAALAAYNIAYVAMNDQGVELLLQRQRASDLIGHIEFLVNTLTHTPRHFAAEFEESRAARAEFLEVTDFARRELAVARATAAGAGAGVAGGAAVAAVAPTAAVWVATAFGTSSTGVAISTLSGAAAKSAALAWLGGGALAAGGGGMAAGSALLALAGPVGWSVAGMSVLTSVTLLTVKRLQGRRARNEAVMSMRANTATAESAASQLAALVRKTIVLRERLRDQFHSCLPALNRSFVDMPPDDQVRLAALVNNTKALSQLLRKHVEMDVAAYG